MTTCRQQNNAHGPMKTIHALELCVRQAFCMPVLKEHK